MMFSSFTLPTRQQSASRQKLAIGLTSLVILIGSIVGWWLSAIPTHAATVNDAYISAATVASSATTLGSTTTYTLTFTTSTDLAAGSELHFNLQPTTGCQAADYNTCSVNLSAATLTGLTGTMLNREMSSMSWQLGTTLTTGTHTVTLSDVVNPTAATALRAAVSTSASDESSLLGSEYSDTNWYATLSGTVINIGTLMVSGTVTAGAVPAGNVFVNLHNADWSISKGSNTDEKGYYAIFLDYEGASFWTSGEYTASVYPEEGSGYINTQKSFTYNGSAVSNDIVLSAAEYFFSGTVVYSDVKSTTVSAEAGDPVTNANVCFNATNGSGSYCDSTDSSGQYTVAVNPGTYNASLSANVDWSNPEEVAAVDWQYQGTNTTYDITERGTQTLSFDVQATTAVVSGTVTIPNSTEAIDGSIGFTNQTANYWGSVNDGQFTSNLNPGTFEVRFSPDTNQNAGWGRYSYKGVVTINEGSNTYDMTLVELTGTLNATVLTAEGTPVADIQVQAWSQDQWTNARTNALGVATLYIAADAWYEVSIWDENYLLAGGQQKVSVADGGSTDVSLVVQLPDATIVATIVNSDGAVPDELHGWLGCETKDFQKHYGEDLNNGTVEIGVAVDDTTGVFEGNCHIWLPDQSSGVAAPQEVSVARNDSTAITFTLQALDATVSTTVKDFATGKKIEADPNVNVTLSNNSDQLWHNALLESNPVLIPVISNKKYTGGLWSNKSDSDYISLWSMNSDTVEVEAGKTGTLVLNVLKKNGTLRVEVKDPNGDPVEHGWVMCGNWEEVNFALDTVTTNTVIDSGGEVRDGVAEVPLVSGHSYSCGVGAPEEFVEQGWLSPTQQNVEFKSKNDTLAPLEFKFKESDATLQGGIKLQTNDATGSVQGMADVDSVWCWAWSEGGSSWGDTEPGQDFRLNLDTAHSQWSAGCDAVIDDTWYFTEQPYEFTPEKGKNTHDFTLKKMGTWKMYEPINETFDATENKVITYGDGTSLTIPSGTLATSGNVTVRGTPETNIIRTDDQPLTIPIDWEAFDENNNLIETFPGGEVTMTVPYSDEALQEFGVDEDSLVGKYWDELSGSWKTPDNVTVDKENNVITITTTHFSQYGVTYNASIGQTDKPTTPTVEVRKIDTHSAKVQLRTKPSSERASTFVVQVRKVGVKAKTHWKTTTIKNPQGQQRLVRTIQKLKSKTDYQLRVKACNSAGCSDPTKWYDFTTK